LGKGEHGIKETHICMVKNSNPATSQEARYAVRKGEKAMSGTIRVPSEKEAVNHRRRGRGVVKCV